MKCPNCNQEIDDNSVFCDYCGKKIAQTTQEQSFTEKKDSEMALKSNTTVKQNKRKVSLLIGIVATLVVIAIIIILSNMGGTVVTEVSDSTAIYRMEQVETPYSEPPAKPILSESERQALLNIGYVDLGLPSGTLWKDQNEDGFYSYADAVHRFGSDFIPTKENLEELKTFCKWEHGGEYGSSIYYKVTGPNGNYIIMQTAGIKEPNNSIDMEGFRGFIYASSPDEEYEYYALVFSRDKIDGVESDYISVLPCRDDDGGYQYSVRLAR